MNRTIPLLAALAALLFSSLPVSAVEIDWVHVGDPGNVPDPSTGNLYGAVSHSYFIDKYEVTNVQYVEFLNSAAQFDYGSNVLGLFNANMGTNPRGGISRSGSGTVAVPYIYNARNDMAEKPVNFVSVFDGMRFANWLNNGQGSSGTESGAYTLLGGSAVPANATTVTRNPNAVIFLPREDEWYKAAYYEPGASNDNYWKFGTRSDAAPTIATASTNGDISNPGPNVVNYSYGADWNGQNGNVTTVGSAGPLSESYYHVADMTGNQYEFTETHWSSVPARFVYRGGSWADGLFFQDSSRRTAFDGAYEPDPAFGFRVAMVPEPSTLALAALGFLALAAWGWRRRKRCLD